MLPRAVNVHSRRRAYDFPAKAQVLRLTPEKQTGRLGGGVPSHVGEVIASAPGRGVRRLSVTRFGADVRPALRPYHASIADKPFSRCKLRSAPRAARGR